jgi:hypothetical protein
MTSSAAQPPNKKVIVCIDVGSSLSKVIYQVGTKIDYLLMQPEHLALPPESAPQLPPDSGMGRPEDNAWIRFKKDAECHAVGRVALDYKAFVNFKTLKSQIATPKILAAIGVIAEREHLSENFCLDLGVLLPWGEIQSRETLETELKAALRSFYFRIRRLKVTLERFQCVPEASGAAMWDAKHDANFRHQNRAYLMFGHRNTSLLFFRKGTLSRKESSTTKLGFYDLIDKMRLKVPGLEREDVLNAIQTTFNRKYSYVSRAYEYEAPETNFWWARLLKSTSPEQLQAQKASLAAAYSTSLKEYWLLLSNWLDSELAPLNEIDVVVRCGGVSDLLAAEVKKFFRTTPIHVPDAYSSNFLKPLGLENKEREKEYLEFTKQNLHTRLADAWGFFAIFSGYKKPTQEVA